MTTSSSDAYSRLLRKFHDQEASFGGGFRSELVAQLINLLNIKSVSDYGAGKRALYFKLKNEYGIDIDYFPFDPAFPEYGGPQSAELVCCLEVLEHVEPEYLESVLLELKHLVTKYGFFSVNCAAAKKFLPDGRNAHLIQQPISWWLKQIASSFEIQYLNKTSMNGFVMLVTPLGTISSVRNPIDISQSTSLRQHFLVAMQRMKIEGRRRIQLVRRKTS